MALIIVFAMLAGIFPVGVFAVTDLESNGETNTIQESTETEEVGTNIEVESDKLELQLTDAEKIATAKVDILTVIENLAVSNETTDIDILTAAQSETLYGVVVEWDAENGFSKTDATISAEGSITGTLIISLNGESDYIFVSKIIVKLPLSDVEKIAAVKVDILTAIDNLAVSNETTDIDILTAAQSETFYDVVVEWDVENGFIKTDATSEIVGSITGTLKLRLYGESEYIFLDKIIEQLPLSEDVKLDGLEESSAGTPEIIMDAEMEIVLEENKIEQFEPIYAMANLAVDSGGLQTSVGTTSYNKNGSAVIIDPGITIEYTENISEASVLIRNLKTGDILSYTTIHGITGIYNSTTGILSLSGTTTALKYEEAMRSVKFSTTSSNTDKRTIDFVLGSGLYFEGHFYEYVSTGVNITWGAAKTAAEGRRFFGRQGYLVTIISAAENEFVRSKTLGLGWIGAQAINNHHDGDWRWVTGPEGLMENGGYKIWSGYYVAQGHSGKSPNTAYEDRYNNWAANEPNNWSGIEYVAHIFGPGDNHGKWNDYSPTNDSVRGYIVEYGGMSGDSDIKVQGSKDIEVNDTYTIIYELNGGIVSANPGTYTSQSEVTLNNPTREDYSFVGWTGSNGTTAQTSVTIATGSTGNKSYTANWKANAPNSAPLTSIVTARTDTSLTITTEVGYEYSVDGSNWYSGTAESYNFTGLTAGTNYNLVYRKAAVTTGNTSAASDASTALAVMTKYAAPAAPSINITLVEENLIRLTVVNFTEYSNDDGTTWQNSNEFNGLDAATLYTFAIRIIETDSTVAGIKASKMQYTAAAKPAVGEGYTLDYATEKISIDNGYEISSDWNYSTGTIIASGSTITPGTTYYIRVAESGDVPKSFSAQFTLPVRPSAPSSLTVNKTSQSITIETIAGQEYKIDSGEWQDSGSFKVLSPNTEYTVYTRVKATETTFVSTVYEMSVTTKSVGSVDFPTLDNVTYDPDKTLAKITISENWAWNEPATVPTVAIRNYSAVYTPKDTDTVDYAEVEGYEVDGNGKVTISEMVSLTVDQATPTAADFNYTAAIDLEYDRSIKTATVVVKDVILGMGEVTVKYYQDDKEVAPINAGIYEVKINITEGANYTAATDLTDSTWTFTIEKIAQQDLSITDKPDSIKYGDRFTLAITGGSGEGDVIWAVTEGNSATVDESTGFVTITGVSKTTITVTKEADGNYIADVTDTYTFTPDKLQLIVDSPTADGGWTKVYDGSTEFDKSFIKVGGITNKVWKDDVIVSVASANYDTADVDTGKELTIVSTIDGVDSGFYSIPDDTAISNASVTPATPVVALVDKTMRYNRSIVDIDPATVTGIAVENDITTNYDGIVSYIYYTKDTCTDDDKTTVNRSGAETIGGAPKYPGTYYVKAFVPANGNYSVATSTVAILRIYNPSSGGGSTPPESTNTNVIVNGEPASAGIETKTTEDGKTTTLVQINNEVIDSKIEEVIKNNDTGMGNAIQISTADKDSEVIAFELTGDIVKKLEDNAFDVSVRNNDIEYIIPAKEFTISKVAETLNIKDKDLKEITVEVRITKPNEKLIESYNQLIKANGAELIFPPVSFEVVAKTTKADGTTEEVKISKFSNYVERMMEVPAGIDPSRISTGIVFNSDGTYSHVPTEVFQKDGKLYARINSLTNSIYSVIWNPVTVKSVENHWSKDTVNDMASRLIIKNPEGFMPNQNITRGEFAEYITKALGIYRSEIVNTQKFSDVKTTHELAYSIEIACEYGIISGYPDGTFKPDAQISREEAMVMYSRAMDIAGLAEADSDRINSYTDKDSVAEWAYNHVKKTISAGVFNGKTNETINPRDTFTCAEAATAIRNLLIEADLINE